MFIEIAKELLEIDNRKNELTKALFINNIGNKVGTRNPDVGELHVFILKLVGYYGELAADRLVTAFPHLYEKDVKEAWFTLLQDGKLWLGGDGKLRVNP